MIRCLFEKEKKSLSPQVTVSPERQGILSQKEPTYLLLFPRKGKTMLWEVEIKNACVTHLILFFNNLLIFLFSRIWILKMSMIYFDVLYYELTQSIISRHSFTCHEHQNSEVSHLEHSDTIERGDKVKMESKKVGTRSGSKIIKGSWKCIIWIP